MEAVNTTASTALSTPAPAKRPLRVVHVLSAMNRGGIETWLMHLLRGADPGRVHYELLLLSHEPGDYDAELAALGVPVWRCSPPNQPAAFVSGALKVLRRGHYDVVHSHVHHFSGAVLALARLAGVPGRLAHSHLDSRSLDSGVSLPRRAYLWLMRGLITSQASEGVAVSAQAAQALFGANWAAQPQRRVIPLGLDSRLYTAPADVQALRRELGVPGAALVIGHVGWFRPAKNHAFLLEVFAEVAAQRPDTRLLLIGVGELQGEVRAQAAALGMGDAVVFAGSRSDVPALLQCLDVFVFPSRLEGLGLALIEAQMAGLPCLSAEGLPPESQLAGTTFQTLPLEAGAGTWAQTVLELCGSERARQPRRYPSRQPFDLAHSAEQFMERYEQYRR